MKKRKITSIGLVLALVVTMFMGAKTDTVYAASYPVVYFDLETNETVLQGDTAKIVFNVWPEYKNEHYYVNVYDKSGTKVAFADKAYYNASILPKKFTINWDTTNVEPGEYTVEVYIMFYTYYSWHEIPTRIYTTITVTKPCNGHTYTASYNGYSYIKYTCSKCGDSKKVAFPEANGDSQPMYRLYLPTNGEHLYTSDRNEVIVLATNNGWTYEGVGWYAPLSGTPVYRLYNSGLKNHLYTSDLNEGNTLTALDPDNWHWDNNAQPLFYSGGSVPIYRVYNEGLSGMHHLTTDYNEYITLPSYGWMQEGISIYAVN